MRRGLLMALLALAFAGCAGVPPEQRACTGAPVSSSSAMQSRVSAARDGDTICVSPGSYGSFSLTRGGSHADDVAVRPNPSGSASAGTVTLSGSWLTLEGWNVQQVYLQPGSDHLSVAYNRISGGYFGVDAGRSTTAYASNMAIIRNKFVGPFGEDAIRANRYHGLLVAGNEITNVRENGNHSDCLQTVWQGDDLTFARNYLHDNRCQGFFVKDQDSTVHRVRVLDNLFVRNDRPCVGVSCGGGPADLDVFGPIDGVLIDRNTTVKDAIGNEVLAVQDMGWRNLTVSRNVLGRLYVNRKPDGSLASDAFQNGYSSSGNLVCDLGLWPPAGMFNSCFPNYLNAAADDYRLLSGQGVTWAPAGERYGP